jgi:homoserine dehydrogenase
VIKLLAIGKRVANPAGGADQVEVRVHPTLVPQDFLLAGVNGVFNAVHVQGDLVGNVLLYGRGAGSEPTSSAVVADVVDVAHNLNAGVANRVPFHFAGQLPVRPMQDVESRFYVRLWVADQPGVLAQIARVFGDHRISIASCIQKESDPSASTAELVIVTHPAREADMQAALLDFAALDVLRELANMIRIETIERKSRPTWSPARRKS